jgi:hypothetical protein
MFVQSNIHLGSVHNKAGIDLVNEYPSITQYSLVIGCVTEPVPKYLQQAAILLLSLRWFGGRIADSAFILCTTGQLTKESESFFQKYGAKIVLVDRFCKEHGPSNKIRFLELSLLDEWDQILLLDCDTVIVQDPSEYLHTTGLSAKIADHPTVTSEQFQELFREYGLTFPTKKYSHDISREQCIHYFNSGVILLNSSWRDKFVNAWSHYNNSIISKWNKSELNNFYTDQASLTLAISATSIPLSPLATSMNLAVHLPASSYPEHFFDLDPYIIHYHGLFDENGYIKHTNLDQANRRIDTFNTLLRAEKMSKPALKPYPISTPQHRSLESNPKIVVGSGWWCDNTVSDWNIGSIDTKSIQFFYLWLNQIVRYLSPHKVIITDSHSPFKPDYAAFNLIQWVELDKNYGHANDIRTKKIITKYSGFTRSVLLGCLYAISCDADYYVYVEQDCLIKGDNFLNHAINESEHDILIGAETEEGAGLNGTTAAPMKQQSLMVVERSGMERLLSGLLGASWSDGEVSPEITMERQLQPLGTLSIPYGRSRPIDFNQPCFYAQHLTDDELTQFIQLEELTELWADLTNKYFFELL